MATDIKMPQLSDTMYSGKILAWRKKEGEAVSRGDILAEVETDKANLEIESFHAGTLIEIRTKEGMTANVGDVIAVIGAADEKRGASAPKAAPQPAALQPAAPPPPRESAQQQGGLQVVSGHAPQANPSTAAYSPSRPEQHEQRIKISPLARKMAEQRNIQLSTLKGSGPNGRITRRDIEDAPAGAQTARPLDQPREPTRMDGQGRLTPFSKMRDTIARRMQESVTQAPHFYVSTSIDMSQTKKLRELLKERPEYKGISINHFIIKAAAYGIEREPRVNNAVRDNQTYEPAQINIGIITAIEDGLLIPVIREANLLPLKDLVFEAKAAVERARAGRPNSSDLTGGTFSISNMGMFDVDNFTAIINPGQGSVLAVSSIKDQPVVQNGQIVPAPIMNVTISVDHRIIDGVMAGNFLKHFKEALENPALLLL